MCGSGPCLTSLCCHSVDGHPLPTDELKGIKPVESINLSGKGLGFESAIIIGACIARNAHLRELKCAQLFVQTWRECESGPCRTPSVFVPFGLHSLDNNRISAYFNAMKLIATPEGPKAIAAALPHCPNLQSLRCAKPPLSLSVTVGPGTQASTNWLRVP